MNDWIRVKDRLPPRGRAVLAIVKYRKPDQWYTYALLVFNGTDMWEHFWKSKDDSDFNENYQVTHWMPLPEPPEDVVHE